MPKVRFLVVAAVTVATTASAQQPRETPFRAAASAIVVDVVVRDQQGRPVTDLQKADFRLLEDGAVQQIGDATLVGTAPQRGGKPREAGLREEASASSDVRTAPAAAGPTFVALVFDRL